MYSSDKYHLGDYEILRVGRTNGPRIDLLPAKGGLPMQIVLGDKAIPLLQNFSDESDITINKKYKHTLLFPFPNRLKDGSYSFQDTTYTFPINEPEYNNALHGMVYGEPFVLTELELTADYGRVELTYLYHGQDEAYPFPFTLRILYEISEMAFKLDATVENTGHSVLPYGFGWHPYFKTDDIAQLMAKPAKLQKINERMLPTGEEQLYNFGEGLENLEDSLDNAFRISDGELLDVTLGSFRERAIRIQADESFKFMQVYNPARDIVAVEPVTSNINALNTGDELILLDKGQTRRHHIEINLI